MAARSDGASRSKSGRRTAPVLDIEALRAGLDASKLVRVSIVPSGSFPDGATGRVRAIGDPDTDGDEFLQVEIGTGRNRDVLPFAPGDLAPYRRGGVRAAPAVRHRRRPHSRRRSRSPTWGPRAGPGRPSPGRRSRCPPRSVSRAAHRPPDPDAPRCRPAQPSPIPPSCFPVPAPRGAAGAAGPCARNPGRARSRSGEGQAAGGHHHGQHRRRVRVAGRGAGRQPGWWSGRLPVSPARVAEIARELDEPRLVEVVDGLLAEHRKAVQTRADQLAAELAEVQAELELFPPS